MKISKLWNQNKCESLKLFVCMFISYGICPYLVCEHNFHFFKLSIQISNINVWDMLKQNISKYPFKNLKKSFISFFGKSVQKVLWLISYFFVISVTCWKRIYKTLYYFWHNLTLCVQLHKLWHLPLPCFVCTFFFFLNFQFKYPKVMFETFWNIKYQNIL